jgi:hypothetical protein
LLKLNPHSEIRNPKSSMHTIRLRGPWQLVPVFRYVRRGDGGFDRRDDDLPAATKQHMPADWSAAFGRDFLGRVRYVRPFHAPPGLQPNERVWLVVEPQRSTARVMLSEETLGVVAADGPPQRFEVTHLLAPHNHLEIFVDHPALTEGDETIGGDAISEPGGLVGEVRLEIEELR